MYFRISILFFFFFFINNFSFAQCIDPNRYAQNCDFDGDGIINSLDIDDDNDGILDFTECNLFSSTNAGFEQPNITQAPFNSNTYSLVNEVNAFGWLTTASDSLIEFWRSGFNGVPSAEGNQFVEINATQVGTLYQNFTIPNTGGILTWSVKHRGRSGVDVANIRIGPTLATIATAITMSDGNTAWGTYTGTITIPPGQTTLTIAFQAVSSVGGASFGNFLDDVKFSIVGSCDTDNDGVPNEFDLDTDGDGCSDINEAGVYAFINTISGAVTSNGILTNGIAGNLTNINTKNAIAGPGVATAPNRATYGANGFYNLIENNNTNNANYQGVYTYSNAINSAISTCQCYKPSINVGTVLDSKMGITSLNRAGATDVDNWPMVRKGAWTVLESKTKGFVINRLSNTEIAAIPAANLVEGMMVFSITDDCIKINITGTSAGWKCFKTQSCPDFGAVNP